MSNHPRILVNGRFVTQQRTGVQNFAHQLCEELLQAGVDFELVIPRNAQVLHPVHGVKTTTFGVLRGHPWEQLELPLLARWRSALLLNLCNTGPMGFSSQITVLHDLAFLVNPKWFRPLFARWYGFMVPRTIKNCQHVVTVSNQMKAELMNRFHLQGNRVSVLGNKVDQELLTARPEKPASITSDTTDFYLMVGSNDPRKNFEPALRVLAGEMGRKILVIGGSAQSFGPSGFFDNTNVIRLGRVGLNELKWAYMNAKALVSPSLYEGFGIPNLEAMALGCPLIVSDIPVFREVCQTAACYFNPKELSTLAAAIHSFESDSDGKTVRINEGKTIFTRYQSENRAKIIREITDMA